MCVCPGWPGDFSSRNSIRNCGLEQINDSFENNNGFSFPSGRFGKKKKSIHGPTGLKFSLFCQLSIGHSFKARLMSQLLSSGPDLGRLLPSIPVSISIVPSILGVGCTDLEIRTSGFISSWWSVSRLPSYSVGIQIHSYKFSCWDRSTGW